MQLPALKPAKICIYRTQFSHSSHAQSTRSTQEREGTPPPSPSFAPKTAVISLQIKASLSVFQRHRLALPNQLSRQTLGKLDLRMSNTSANRILHPNHSLEMRITRFKARQISQMRLNLDSLEAGACRFDPRDESEQVVSRMRRPRMGVGARISGLLRPGRK